MITGFHDKILNILHNPLTAFEIKILQANIGYRCNMACKHCHVDAGPGRHEIMDKETMDTLLEVLKAHDIPTLDITGGAPELNPHFTYLVKGAKKAGRHVIVRTNLTILADSGFDHYPEFCSEHDIEITASLPYYLESFVNRVRGEGAFGKSIEAIKGLNRLGYGKGEGTKKLNLVYNPPGAFLAPEQKNLEDDYRKELADRYGITFDHLFVFTNMPIGRFRTNMAGLGALEKYMEKLSQSFNPATIDGLMCRHLISVGWNGKMHDCDFNQALALNMHSSYPQLIGDFSYERLRNREIQVGDHCYGCTAGQGST